MKKGFTLIELLAVIAILAIIMLIATPKVLDTINSAGTGTFTTSSQALINIAKTYSMTENLSMPENGEFISIPISDLDFENGATYGITGGIILANTGTAPADTYKYYIYLSNDDFVVNGADNAHVRTSLKSKGISVPNTAITLPTSGSILINTILGITGHVENETVAGGGYVLYSHA